MLTWLRSVMPWFVPAAPPPLPVPKLGPKHRWPDDGGIFGRPAARRIWRAQENGHRMEVALRDFVLAYEESIPEQMGHLHGEAVSILEEHDFIQAELAHALREQ